MKATTIYTCICAKFPCHVANKVTFGRDLTWQHTPWLSCSKLAVDQKRCDRRQT